MKTKLLFVALLSVSFLVIYSSDLPDQVSLSRDLGVYEDSPENIRFLNSKIEQLESLGLPPLQGKMIALNITRLEDGNRRIRVNLGLRDRWEREFVINQDYDSNDDARKIFNNIAQYFINQPEQRLIAILMQDTVVGENSAIYWLIGR